MENHEYKLDLSLDLISSSQALKIVQEQHYSNTLPKINKCCLGIYIDDNLEGCITLGYGTRPKHTIKKMFPSLNTSDYLEIGRMCINDKFKTNTESQMLSKTIKYIKKNFPNVKLLFTWSDGIYGKCGTVYQASNFLYGGFITTEVYLYNGVKIHPRGMKELLNPDDSRLTVRPTAQQKKELGIEQIKGKQFRYCYFLCGYTEKRKLVDESPFEWTTNYPSYEDCTWKRWVAPNKYEFCEQPIINTDSKEVLKKQKSKQLTLDCLFEKSKINV